MRNRLLLSVSIVVLALTAQANAKIEYFIAWVEKYPTSTLGSRMQDLTGASCNICHHPPTRGDVGTCYREDIRVLLDGGATIQEALDQLDGEDSDGDGVPNGVEILKPRLENPAEIGYHPGLIGATGTDPCGDAPGDAVTGMLETPQADVPAVSEWGLLAMGMLLMSVATAMIHKRRTDAIGTHRTT